MKVGDLVQLSAAGEKIASNWSMRDELGIILSINHNHENPFEVNWLRMSIASVRYRWHMKRYELKKLKAAK